MRFAVQTVSIKTTAPEKCGWVAPVLSERSEFSGASIFCFVFVAIDKNEGAMLSQL